MKKKISRPRRAKPIVSTNYFRTAWHRFQRADRTIQILELLFCDVESRNSFSVAAANELGELLNANRSIDGLLFRSQGRVFCSGGNLKDHLRAGKTESRNGNRTISDVLDRLQNTDFPTVALVEGDAFGGGLELISAFDFVVSTPHVHLEFWQRKMGLIYGWGGGARIATRVGAHRVAQFGIEMKSLSGREALRLGLVDRIVAPASAVPEAIAELLKLASLPKSSVAAFKRVRAGESERTEFEKLWFGSEHREQLLRVSARTSLSKARG